MATILKNVTCNISATVQLILMKIGTTMRLISFPNLMGDQKFINLKIKDSELSWES